VQDKFAIAHQVRLFEHLLRTRESTARAEQCRALSTKLAEDRFTLAVVGQFVCFRPACVKLDFR
jgi:hypothetical protein